MIDIISIYISLGALVVSVFSLGWNFYRDVVLKPRLSVRIMKRYIVHGTNNFGPFVNISAVNVGPGEINCETVNIAKKSCFRFLGRKLSEYALRLGRFWTFSSR